MKKVNIPPNVVTGSVTFTDGATVSFTGGAVIEMSDAHAATLINGFTSAEGVEAVQDRSPAAG